MENGNENLSNAPIPEIENFFSRDEGISNSRAHFSDGVYFRTIGYQHKHVLFEAVSRDVVSLDTLNKLQTLLGYNPKGYGGPEGVTFEKYRNLCTHKPISST